MKRIISCLLALVLVFTPCLPSSAEEIEAGAADSTEGSSASAAGQEELEKTEGESPDGQADSAAGAEAAAELDKKEDEKPQTEEDTGLSLIHI